jgi:hypothetical protein
MDVVLSRYLLDELARVLPRLNHRLKWQPADFADLIVGGQLDPRKSDSRTVAKG